MLTAEHDSRFEQLEPLETDEAFQPSSQLLSAQELEDFFADNLSARSLNILKLYFKEIDQYPLLTRDEETVLGECMDLGKVADYYLDRSRAHTPNEINRQQVLLERYSDINQATSRAELEQLSVAGWQAEDWMTKCNLRLALSVALKYIFLDLLPLPDLIQEANTGLMQAVYKFEADRGLAFVTMAYWWLRQAVCHGISDKGRLIDLPANKIEKCRILWRRSEQLRQELGREPSTKEMAEDLEWEEEEVRDLLLISREVESFDRPLTGRTSTLGEMYQDPDQPLSSRMVTPHLMRMDVEAAIEEQYRLGRITARQKEILEWRFGFVDGELKSRKEIGLKLGLNRESVRLEEVKVLSVLQRYAGHLKLYLGDI